MAWTPPRTWAPRTKVTAAILNAELSGNLNQIASPPYCNLYATAATTMTTAGTVYAVAFDGEVADTESMHSTSTNTSRITIVTAGLYHIEGGAGVIAQTLANRFQVMVLLDGSAVRQTYTSIYVPPSGTMTGHFGARVSLFVRLTVGQYVELGVRSSIASVPTEIGTAAQSFLQARWMGP